MQFDKLISLKVLKNLEIHNSSKDGQNNHGFDTSFDRKHQELPLASQPKYLQLSMHRSINVFFLQI